MRKTFRSIAALALSALAVVACDKNNDTDTTSKKEEALQKVNEAFVDNTVIPTYKALADKSLDLMAALESVLANPTDASVKTACDLWKSARQYWEWSEASFSEPLPSTASTLTSTPGLWTRSPLRTFSTARR